MKKKMIIFFVMFLSFFMISTKVEAGVIEHRKVFDNELNTEFNVINGSETSADCDGIFTKEALDLISKVLGYFRILAPIVLIVMVAVDFGGAILQQDNDAMKKATGKIVKRSLATMAVFFVPTIIKVLIDLPSVRDTIQIPDDPLCGTLASVVDENELLIK